MFIRSERLSNGSLFAGSLFRHQNGNVYARADPRGETFVYKPCGIAENTKNGMLLLRNGDKWQERWGGNWSPTRSAEYQLIEGKKIRLYSGVPVPEIEFDVLKMQQIG